MRFWRWRKRAARNVRPNYVGRSRDTFALKLMFVETIPQLSDMEERTLYVSMRFATLSHLCPCGCRRLVDVTLDPTTRSLTYDGDYLTLRPSIGVKFPCRSHYSIVRNTVMWHLPISKSESRWYKRVARLWPTRHFVT